MRTLLFIICLIAVPCVSAQSVDWQWNNLNTLPVNVHNHAMAQNQGVAAMDSLFPELTRVSPDNATEHRLMDGPNVIAVIKKFHLQMFPLASILLA
jgi:hypothetical protein